ncbi:MAG: hypothetical protein GVY18_03380 [Bacteroidetes bacterium]|jgi:hypothetical protein|nr:hypothetical protein [Bacteroidota bacterium]
MGLAKLNIFVSGIDDPCTVDQRTWYVTIFNCDGSVLEHCGTRYVVRPAPCGHLHVEIPPGCYYIKAVWGFTVVTPNLVYRANHFTDAAIVTACCEQTTCVKLFNPSVHRCGYIYVRALRDLARQGVIEGNLADRAARIVEDVAEQDEDRPMGRFEMLIEEEIEQELKRRMKEEQRERKGRTGEDQ